MISTRTLSDDPATDLAADPDSRPDLAGDPAADPGRGEDCPEAFK